MSQPYSYRNPTLSLWQAAVAEVHGRRDSANGSTAIATTEMIAMPPLLAEDRLMSPVHTIAASLAGQPSDAGTFSAEGTSTTLDLAETAAAVPFDCAKVAAEFLWAEMAGDIEKSRVLAGELKYAVCDAIGWSECVTTYLGYKASGGSLPYRPNKNVVVDLDRRTKIAIIGDWGTGDEVAINLLQQVASLQPEVLVHLGDVYYAGTQHEEQANFLDICRQVLGQSIPLFSLCGNHDMYSGGNGYYWLIDQIGQQASYFCLQNANWQFLAMDTGHNDNDPLTITGNMTSLMTADGWSEGDWHITKVQQAGNRRTVLLSHHQLFSPFAAVGNVDGRPYAYNPKLFANFQAVLASIDWWFWGHEHTLAVFDPYMGLKRGRCIGASAVPVFTDQQKYANASGLKTYQNAPLPTWNSAGVLGDNGTDYSHAFAIMTLNVTSADVDYYQVPILGTASKLNLADSA